MKFRFLLCIDDMGELGGERSCYDCAFRHRSAQSFIYGFGQIKLCIYGVR